MAYHHICGLYFLEGSQYLQPMRKYLPRVSLAVHAQIIGTTSRTVLTQKFVNPSQDASIPELRYTFPLYDGVSVVGFVCTINNDRVIRGVVKERDQARRTFKEAVDRGETAGLLEQLPDASDVFTTTIGNVPAGAEIKVDITYLGELKHDAETNGIRFTIPTSIAPRYGSYPGELLATNTITSGSGIEIVVDAEMPNGSNIKSVQSPSHPISVTIGNTSISPNADMSLQKASATLSLSTAELDTDFIVHVVATDTSSPVAVLETHPTIPNQRALMATLVPKFNLPPTRPEIVFVCDRSGSMSSNISYLKQALHIFLKSLPLGVKFNICSFGSRHEFLFKKGSRSYDAASLEEATRYVDTFGANFGGTEMYKPLEDTFKKRFKDMELEVFLLTDGEIWDQDRLFALINKHVSESKGNTRVFTLGIGNDVSHSLIEGVARAGNGFAQSVAGNEKMNSKVVRMLKASLSPHIKDYALEIKYGNEQPNEPEDDDFEIIEKVMDSMVIDVREEPEKAAVPTPSKPISLFDTSADPDVEMVDATLDLSAGAKYSHVPLVAEPKLLQAPFEIPPLYPFNRTTIYLLLSAKTSQRTPKSVVLRGTSAHGPLELEIPVTILPQKGETIHQLAARKAVKELEEGRGWIFHAKDAKEPTKLLKDKFEGRFSDMVEREAVRLGVAFQVGGKWCSFVAVEENTANSPSAQQAQLKTQQQAQMQQARPMAHVQAQQQIQMQQQQGAAMPFHHSHLATSATSFHSASGSYQQYGKQCRTAQPMAAPAFYHAPAPASLPRGSVFVPGMGVCKTGGVASRSRKRSAAPAAAPSAALSVTDDDSDDDTGFGLFDGPNIPAAPSNVNFQMDFANPVPGADVANDFDFDSFVHEEGSSGQDSVQEKGPVTAFCADESETFKRDRRDRESPAAPTTRSFLSLSARSHDAEHTPSTRSAKRTTSSRKVAPSKEEIFATIVSLQLFTGSWQWNDELLELLQLDGADLAIKFAALNGQFAAAGHADIFKTETDLMATALVLAFLEKTMASQKDEWEMLAEKATGWMAGQLNGALTADELVGNVMALI